MPRNTLLHLSGGNVRLKRKNISSGRNLNSVRASMTLEKMNSLSQR